MFETFSRRKAKASGTKTDVYQYEQLPQKLKVQLVHIFQRVIRTGRSEMTSMAGNIYEMARDTMREEEGVFQLESEDSGSKRRHEAEEELLNYLLNCPTDQALDIVEILCTYMLEYCTSYMYAGFQDAEDRVENEIRNINRRFNENGVGFRFEDGQIIQIDSTLLHKEAMQPALDVLRLPGYSGSQSEFLKAHEHYRHGRNSEAIIDCHKAFESLMKAICTKRKWAFDATKAAAHLVDVCISNGLLQKYQQNSLTGLRSVLESAIPTPRNKTAAHGAGVVPVTVPDELASYVIHLTASTLLFLANSERALP